MEEFYNIRQKMNISGLHLFNFWLKKIIKSFKIEFVIWDLAGQDEYERLRPICYKETQIVLVCYSIDLPDSLSNVVEKWYPELRYFCPLAPIILVGKYKMKRFSI